MTEERSIAEAQSPPGPKENGAADEMVDRVIEKGREVLKDQPEAVRSARKRPGGDPSYAGHRKRRT